MNDAVFPVLIVEDKDKKFDDLAEAISSVNSQVDIVRAHTVAEAENLLESRSWRLLVLDISMDINGPSQGALGGGHANLGGLDILDTMYYHEISLPTVVVTGFDYFLSAPRDETEYIGLAELDQLVRKRLGDNYVGCLRYGRDQWRERLMEAAARSLC